MEKELNEFLNGVAASMEQRLETAEHVYVVSYTRKTDGLLIGYHASTMCQVTPDLLSGKRYTGDNPYKQMATIQKNLQNVLETEFSDRSVFAPLKYDIKCRYFDGLTLDDIQLDAVYLDKDVPKHIFKFTKVS